MIHIHGYEREDCQSVCRKSFSEGLQISRPRKTNLERSDVTVKTIVFHFRKTGVFTSSL